MRESSAQLGLLLIKKPFNMQEKIFNGLLTAIAVGMGSTLVYAISFAIYQLVVNGSQTVNI
jgi:hypothetical protein